MQKKLVIKKNNQLKVKVEAVDDSQIPQIEIENKTSSQKSNNVPKVKKFDKLKQLTAKALSETSTHGLSHIFKSNNIIAKIMWGILFLASIGICSYVIIQSVFDYLDYRITTETSRYYEIPTIFPKVTICNKNMFTTEDGLNFVKGVIKQNGLTNIFNETIVSKKSILSRKSDITEVLNIATAKANRLSSNEREKLMYKLENILIECSFEGVACNHTDFSLKYSNSYGYCYVFNSDKANSKYSSHSSDYYGLKLTLFVGMVNGLKLMNTNTGLMLKIENNTILYPISKETYLSPGFETSVGIERAFVFKKSKPYTNCDIDNESPGAYSSDLYNLILNSKYQYTQSACLDLCFQKLLIFHCNCTDNNYFSLYNEVENCLTLAQYECMIKAKKIFLTNNYVSINCLPLCPMECNETSFVSYSSSSLMNTDMYVDFIKKDPLLSTNFANQTITSDTLKESLLKFRIFYASLSYTVSTDSPAADIPILLSNIGGILGLFLGKKIFYLINFFTVFLSNNFGIVINVFKIELRFFAGFLFRAA